jgi:hypothetical protein
MTGAYMGAGAGCGTGALTKVFVVAAAVLAGVCVLADSRFAARDSPRETGAKGTRGTMIRSQVSRQALNILTTLLYLWGTA